MTADRQVEREVERKYRVSQGFELPELAINGGRVEGPKELDLTAIYLDTADLRLSREGISLRHRSGPGEDRWTLKLPVLGAEPGHRDEISEGGPLVETPPPGLLGLLAAYLRGSAPRPVATLATRRRAYAVLDAGGECLAEVVDDNVEVLHGGHAAARFREVEVEDRGGGEAVLGSLDQRLRDAGAVSGQFEPKVVRALGRRASLPPDPPEPAAVQPDDPARLAVTSFLRRHVRALLAQDPRVRLDLPSAVHQMRVATRRLRSGLGTFAALVDDDWAGPLRGELRWLGGELGAARDSEVLRRRLTGSLERADHDDVLEPARVALGEQLDHDVDAGRARALDALASDRYLALVESLVDGAWDPRLRPAADDRSVDVLPALVRKPWKRLRARAEPLLRHADGPEDYHRARVAAKKARYAAEAVEPVLGGPARRYARQMERVQEVLGEHQDAVVAGAYLRRLAVDPSLGEGAFTLGVLHAREEDLAQRQRARFARLWPKVARGRYRRWLRS